MAVGLPGSVSRCSGSCGTAAFRRERIISHDVQLDPLWGAFRDFAAHHGIRSAWSSPIFAADGRSNWAGLVERLARALGPNSNRSDPASSFSEIRMDRGTIVIKDATHNATEVLDNVEMALAWPSISKSFAANGRVMWHDEPMDVALTLTDFAAALAGDRSGLKLRIHGNPLKAAFEGNMSVRPTLKVEGTLAADSTSLRDTFRWAGIRPLSGGGFGPFALKARTTVSGGTIALNGVNIELDGNAAEGVLTYATDGRQAIQGTLAANELDQIGRASCRERV